MEALVALGNLALALRQWSMAAGIWAQVRNRWPALRAGHMGLGKSLTEQGKQARAYEVIRDWVLTKNDLVERDDLILLYHVAQADVRARYEAYARARSNTGQITDDPVVSRQSKTGGPKVALVLYARGEPYVSTAQKLVASFRDLCRFDHEVHLFDHAAICHRPWFSYLQECLDGTVIHGRREGFYNAWKGHIVRDVFNSLNDGDMLYYVDSSRYYPIGFYEDLNTLFSIQAGTDENLFTGSFNRWLTHTSYDIGNKPQLYELMGMADRYAELMEQPALLNSSFLLKKGPKAQAFADEWADGCRYELVSLHHSVDQSVFSALVYKHGMRAFDLNQLEVVQLIDGGHIWGKNHNTVHGIVNRDSDPTRLFVKPGSVQAGPHPLARYQPPASRA